MKVLIIGGTGVLGRSFVRLADPGDRITILTRNPSSAEPGSNARVLQGSILDRDSLKEAVRGQDVILNFASCVPKKLKTVAEDWAQNDEVRTAGTSNLLEALRGREVFYCQAGMTLVYGDHGGDPVTEGSELRPNRLTATIQTMERLFLEAPGNGLRGVSFRFSVFYHPEAWHTRAMVHELKNRRLPIIGDGEYYWNMIHVDDAARAVRRIVESREEILGREILNVSDNEPVKSKEFLIHLASRLNVPEPIRMPQFIARMALGGDAIEVVTASHRCRTEKIQGFGWKPSFPTYREGFASILNTLTAESAV